MTKAYIAVDLVKVYKSRDKKPTNLLTVLAWGDVVEVLEEKSTHIKISLTYYNETREGGVEPVKKDGFILPSASNRSAILKPLENKDVLMVSFVDVQQGDGCVIETPDGKVILVDGGENQMFARYLAARFPGT